MKYCILERIPERTKYNSGSKARNDINAILTESGVRPLNAVFRRTYPEHCPLPVKIRKHFEYADVWRKTLGKLKRGDEVFIQYPVSHGTFFLAGLLKQEGRKVVLAAADTFRAAAGEQLDIWAKRSGCEIIKQNEGSDPAAVIFDAIAAAKARGADVIICDTAGRLHNKKHLMDELAKINRVIDRELPDAAKEKLLVLDATTGQNAVNQAEQFREATGITGIVLTKLDGTAKGGVVLAIKKGLGVPVKYIGVGEQIDDLQPFDAHDFARALFAKAED